MSDTLSELKHDHHPDHHVKPMQRTFSNTRMADMNDQPANLPRKISDYKMHCEYNPIPQAAPGASAAVGHNIAIAQHCAV